MKKKKLRFDVLSKEACSCGQLIKQNVIDRKPDAAYCFKCWMNLSHQMMASAHEVKSGRKTGRSGGIHNPIF